MLLCCLWSVITYVFPVTIVFLYNLEKFKKWVFTLRKCPFLGFLSIWILQCQELITSSSSFTISIRCIGYSLQIISPNLLLPLNYHGCCLYLCNILINIDSCILSLIIFLPPLFIFPTHCPQETGLRMLWNWFPSYITLLHEPLHGLLITTGNKNCLLGPCFLLFFLI